jgi:coiled-coil domain-containing protein 6
MGIGADVEKTAQLAREEQHMREENLRLRRKLELEVERRQELCRLTPFE